MAGPTTFNELLSKQSSSLLKDPDYWRSLCPCATISYDKDGSEDEDDDDDDDDHSNPKDNSTIKEDDNNNTVVENNDNHKEKILSSSMISEGYALTDFIESHSSPQDKKKLKKIFASLSATVKTLSSKNNNNFPATMILLYDETWQLARYASQLMTSSTSEKNVFNFDILAWYIDASTGDVGFSPHRDRQPDDDNDDDVASTFHSDGHAKYVTLWLALSDAHPENSCLYVIPKRYDPGYYDGDDDDDDDDSGQADPLRKALPDKESYQNIRAIPRQTGQGVIFTHRIMHWGSRGNPSCTDPRIAISFVASDPTFEKPYLVNSSFLLDKNNNNRLALPPFEVRLLLACSQLLTYYQRFNLSRGVIKTCYEYCKEHEQLLEENYRKKVFLEFVKAMKEINNNDDKEMTTTAGCCSKRQQQQQQQQQQQEMGSRKRKHNGHDNNDSDDNSDDEDQELVLEEMLNAEAEGYGDFEDDYDDIEGQDNDLDKDFDEENFDDDDNDDDDGSGMLLFKKRPFQKDEIENKNGKENRKTR